MCGSMVDIQSATAEISRGKKEEEDEERRNHRAKILLAALFHRATITRMWTNVQRDGRPAECTVGGALCSTPQSLAESTTSVPCSNAAKTRNPLKFAGVPQTPKPILSAIVGRSSPYCGNMLRRYCCLTIFFRLSIRALVANTLQDRVVRWCRDGHFCIL